ncbi:15129_t:CDS:2, partial [Racocetra fulgida]
LSILKSLTTLEVCEESLTDSELLNITLSILELFKGLEKSPLKISADNDAIRQETDNHEKSPELPQSPADSDITLSILKSLTTLEECGESLTDSEKSNITLSILEFLKELETFDQ